MVGGGRIVDSAPTFVGGDFMEMGAVQDQGLDARSVVSAQGGPSKRPVGAKAWLKGVAPSAPGKKDVETVDKAAFGSKAKWRASAVVGSVRRNAMVEKRSGQSSPAASRGNVNGVSRASSKIAMDYFVSNRGHLEIGKGLGLMDGAERDDADGIGLVVSHKRCDKAVGILSHALFYLG
jgi:hypothetical protein